MNADAIDIKELGDKLSNVVGEGFANAINNCEDGVEISAIIDPILTAALAPLLAKIAKDDARIRTLMSERDELRYDQSQWRKGVDLIKSAAGYQGDNLCCVKIAEHILGLRAELEQLKQEPTDGI